MGSMNFLSSDFRRRKYSKVAESGDENNSEMNDDPMTAGCWDMLGLFLKEL